MAYGVSFIGTFRWGTHTGRLRLQCQLSRGRQCTAHGGPGARSARPCRGIALVACSHDVRCGHRFFLCVVTVHACLFFSCVFTWQWHTLNIQQNPSHYSFMRHLGAGSIAYLQENVGGRLWYNTAVRCIASALEGNKAVMNIVVIDVCRFRWALPNPPNAQ